MMVSPALHIYIKRLEDLTSSELFEIFKLRCEVFVVEQNCIYADIDNQDKTALHVVATARGEIAGTARIIEKDQAFRIGRVVVHPAHRNKKLASQMMHDILDYLKRTHPGMRCSLSAQTHLIGFYQSHGFELTGTYYLEDSIPHADMELIL